MGDLFKTLSDALRPDKVKVCQECEGTGKVYYSCCGDDMRGFDIDLCPTCKEHQGMEGEVCESCNGKGSI